jgi:hypothetical protein
VERKKLTLSVRGDLIDEVKRIAVARGRSLSSIVEEYFEYLVSKEWIDALANELGLSPLESTSMLEIVESRPEGLDASMAVREVRGERARRILDGKL